jgi:hypothetical protein
MHHAAALTAAAAVVTVHRTGGCKKNKVLATLCSLKVLMYQPPSVYGIDSAPLNRFLIASFYSRTVSSLQSVSTVLKALESPEAQLALTSAR